MPPPGSIHAMLPPPAPSVWMSTVGTLMRQAVDFALARAPHLSPVRETHVEAGTAHVDRDRVRLAGAVRKDDAADDARGRPRQHGAHGGVGRRPRGRRPAVGLHDVDVGGQPQRGDAVLEPPEVAAHHRRDVGVDHRGAHALVLFELGQHLVRQHDDRVGHRRAQRLPDPLLVRRVGVGVEQADRDRVDVGCLDPLDQGLEVVRRRSAASTSPVYRTRSRISNLRSRGTSGSGRCMRQSYRCGRSWRPMCSTSRKPSGDDERGAGAGALQQRVGRHGRAVDQEVDGRRGDAEALDQLAGAAHDALGLLARRTGLRELQPAGGDVVQRKVGEGAADVDAEPMRHDRETRPRRADRCRRAGEQHANVRRAHGYRNQS